MQNKKDNQMSGSESSMSTSSNKDSGMGNQSGKKSGTTSNRGTGSNSGMEDDDEMMTSGGRQGNFSDKDRESEQQWSPGSTGSSDQ